jgi:hypothetical protein
LYESWVALDGSVEERNGVAVGVVGDDGWKSRESLWNKAGSGERRRESEVWLRDRRPAEWSTWCQEASICDVFGFEGEHAKKEHEKIDHRHV